MKSIHAAIAIVAGLLLALWWGVAPPRFAPAVQPALAASAQHQCPGNSRLDGKLCTCPEGTRWAGASCTQAWSGSARLLPVPPKAGSVARIESAAGDFSGTGNIAIVESVGESSLTIIEGDKLTGAVTRRSASGKDLGDAARKLGIVGYVKD